MSKSYEIDMCHGPLGGKIIVFALPLMLSSMLQLLFNAADVIVVGRFAGSEALAAVGSNGPLINLMVNLFIGLSVGVNVIVAREYGAKRHNDISTTVHTAVLISVIGGFLIAAIGIPFSKTALKLMGSPDNVIDLSSLYLKIYFAGMPATLVYNFGSAILRASGDTKRPLYFLLTAGIINVLLNLFFVIVCKMSVAGVALATVISQVISAVMIIRCLMYDKGSLKLDLRKLKINKRKFIQIIKIGLPAGLQGMVFSLSNIVLQSAINSFGSDAMAGNAAAQNIEGFIYMAMNAFHQSSLTFTGQNAGAGKYKRVRNIFYLCSFFVTATGVLLGSAALLFGHQLLSIYSSSQSVISEGLIRMKYVCGTYALCGLMEVAVGSIRGMGYSVMPMVVSLLGACGLRLVWVATIFRMNHTSDTLFLSYPISWGITFLTHCICFAAIYRKMSQNKSL